MATIAAPLAAPHTLTRRLMLKSQDRRLAFAPAHATTCPHAAPVAGVALEKLTHLSMGHRPSWAHATRAYGLYALLGRVCGCMRICMRAHKARMHMLYVCVRAHWRETAICIYAHHMHTPAAPLAAGSLSLLSLLLGVLLLLVLGVLRLELQVAHAVVFLSNG